MKDRVPGKPNRMKITFDDGQIKYAVVERADEPIEAGTPLNKASLLSDTTAEKLGLSADATLDMALRKLVTAQSYAKLTTTVNKYINNASVPQYDGIYNIFAEAEIYGEISTVAATGGFSGIIIPQGAAKIRVKAWGDLRYSFDNVAVGEITHDLVINGIKYPLHFYNDGYQYNSRAISREIVDEDRIYAVKAGDIVGISYTQRTTLGTNGANIVHDRSKLIVEVLA